jgi:hypothetical protein
VPYPKIEHLRFRRPSPSRKRFYPIPLLAPALHSRSRSAVAFTSSASAGETRLSHRTTGRRRRVRTLQIRSVRVNTNWVVQTQVHFLGEAGMGVRPLITSAVGECTVAAWRLGSYLAFPLTVLHQCRREIGSFFHLARFRRKKSFIVLETILFGINHEKNSENAQ